MVIGLSFAKGCDVILFLIGLLFGDARALDLPPRPSAQEVQAWSPVQYNNFLAQVDTAILNQIVAQIQAKPVMADEQMFLSFIAQLKAVLHEGRRTCSLMPPYRGDSTFRDAFIESYDEVIVAFSEDLPAVARLTFQQNVRDEDLAALEAAQQRLDAVSATAVSRITTAQGDFVRRHGGQIVQNTEGAALEQELREATTATFTAPGLPPDDSVLGADIHCDFALRYYNQMIDSYNAAIDAYSALMEASGEPGALSAAIPETREALSVALETSSGWGAWQGDAGLQEANTAMVTGMLTLLDGTVAELGVVYESQHLRAKDATRAEILSTEIDTTIDALLNESGQAYEGYMDRWHLDAYQQWLAAQGRLNTE